MSPNLKLLMLHVLAVQCGFVLTAEQSSYTNPFHEIKPRSTTSDQFLPGPDGELCILNKRHIEDRRYEHQDDNGRCCCSLCNPRSYIKQFCQCGGGKEVPTVYTECVLVEQGKQYMNALNKCTQPYTCSTCCKSHQVKVKECTSHMDITCECEDDWYNPHPAHVDGNTIPRECRMKPRCPAGQGIHVQTQQVSDSDEIIYTCQPCKPNYFQKYNDSKASCQPHRACQVQAGSAQTDNICIHDKLLDQLSNRTDVTDLVTPSGSKQSDPIEDIPVPTDTQPTNKLTSMPTSDEERPQPTHPGHGDKPTEKDMEPIINNNCGCPAVYISVPLNVVLIGVLVALVAGWYYFNKKTGNAGFLPVTSNGQT